MTQARSTHSWLLRALALTVLPGVLLIAPAPAAGAMNQLLRQQACLHAREINLKQTMNVAAWRTADRHLRILAGNLEEGLRDDADLSRHAALEVPSSWGATQWKDLWTGRNLSIQGLALSVDLPQAASMLIEGSR